MKVIVILGPTGVGKTRLSVMLAHAINGEIINGDSTQVYKGLDIATAKVTEDEMDGIKHHLIDIKELDEDYTIYDYQIDCRNAIEDINKRGKVPIIVGGSGLYLKAALYDYQLDIKETKDYSYLSNDELYNKVLEMDSNNNIHKNNRRRLERALQYMEETKQPYSAKEITNKLLYDTTFICLSAPREILYNNINKRVDKMLENGLLEEARMLYQNNIRTKAVITPIGYKELFLYFSNELTLNESLDLIRKNSRKYAKRQFTWFRTQMDVNYVEVDFNNFDNTLNECIKIIKK